MLEVEAAWLRARLAELGDAELSPLLNLGSSDLNFRTCCEEHDYHYRSGDIPRAEADRRLRQCIRAKGWILTPWLYWLGVRLFGRSAYKGK